MPVQKEPLFQKYSLDPKPLTRGLVSCTGAQFCGVALIETKQRAAAIAAKLENELDIPQTVRMHWTGCPNSCGQVRLLNLCPLLAASDQRSVSVPTKFDGASHRCKV